MTAADSEAARTAAFDALTRSEQAEVIQRMAAAGVPEYTIAHATRLAVEQVRAILGERGVARR